MDLDTILKDVVLYDLPIIVVSGFLGALLALLCMCLGVSVTHALRGQPTPAEDSPEASFTAMRALAGTLTVVFTFALASLWLTHVGWPATADQQQHDDQQQHEETR